MRLSIVLLDWNVRESFHVLDYLAKQDYPRAEFEIIWVDYYPREFTSALYGKVDQHIELDNPASRVYHKHQMYNAAILAARGKLICFMDSDAIVTPKFVRELIKWTAPGTLLHLDEVRSQNKKFYPFSNPTIEDLKAPPSNWDFLRSTTTGMAAKVDTVHARNYGACLCAPIDAVLKVGGADEHEEYRGHICGPYDMTFRLVNYGLKERWHPTEFLYHAWHPGQDGINNPMGPHDGRKMAVRAMLSRNNGRVFPWKENGEIQEIRVSKCQ